MSENRDGTLVPPSYTPESPVSLEYKKVALKSHLCSINGSEQAVASVVPGSDSVKVGITSFLLHQELSQLIQT